MNPTETPVSAQVESTPPTISATRDAANKNDFSAFNDAHVAAKRGAPLARVEAPTPDPATPETPAPAVSATPSEPRQLSKRQQDINDRAQKAADAATATLREENTRLKAQLAAHTPPAPVKEPAATATPEAKVAEYKRFLAMPDAPKLEDFDSVQEHTAAMSLFVNDKRHEERATAAQQQTRDAETERLQQERVTSFLTKLDAAKQDPTFVPSLSAEVKALKPVSGLTDAEKQTAGPLNILWEYVYDSPHLAAHLRFFSEHPDELRRLEAATPAISTLPAHLRAKAHIPWLLQEFGKLDAKYDTATPAGSPAGADASASRSPITAAPPPPDTVSRAGASADPKTSALSRGDFRAFNEQELASRARKRAHA